MAILLNESASKNLFTYPLLSESLFLATKPKKGRVRKRRGSPTVSLIDLASLPFVLPSKFVPLRQQIESTLERVGLVLHVIAEIDSVQTLKAAVMEGLGATILPWSALHKEAKEGTLVIEQIVNPAMSWDISLCTAERELPNSSAQVVRELIPAIVSTLVVQQTWQGVKLAGS